jgi:hypothetical protein
LVVIVVGVPSGGTAYNTMRAGMGKQGERTQKVKRSKKEQQVMRVILDFRERSIT